MMDPIEHGSKDWPLAYIASPYTLGDQATNVAQQIKIGHILLSQQIAPVVPTLNHFMQIMHQRDEEEWMQMDFALLRHCKALLRMPGQSKGADREVTLANELGIPVFRHVESIIRELRP